MGLSFGADSRGEVDRHPGSIQRLIPNGAATRTGTEDLLIRVGKAYRVDDGGRFFEDSGPSVSSRSASVQSLRTRNVCSDRRLF